jgi:hypothetical protein
VGKELPSFPFRHGSELAAKFPATFPAQLLVHWVRRADEAVDTVPSNFGTAAVSFYTSKVSLLANLIGGNTDTNFSILSVRGIYLVATMTVSLKPFADR